MSLELFFQGNVNEQGELDQEGYDEGTKAGLTLATTRDKDTIVGNAVTAEDTRAVDDDGTIPKLPDAVDFRDEQEAADDDDDTANDVYAEKAKRMLQTQPAAPAAAARKTDDDYDEYDEPEDAGQSAAAAAPAPPAPAPAASDGSGKDAVQDDSPAAPATDTSLPHAAAPAKKQPEAPVEVRRKGMLLFS